ncbi:MAG: S1C family serine protease, partial [Acidimicrobiales bacterium]
RAVGLAAIAIVAAACGSSPSGNHSTSSTTAAPGSPGAEADALQQEFVAVVAKVRPQVVEISSTTNGQLTIGSGVVYDTQGDIVTNDHVVSAAQTYQVQLSNGQSSMATLVGAYAPDDLAVIRLHGVKGLSAATFGDSSTVQIGDIVLAVGSPLGLSGSVTEGIVSFNGRAVQESSGGQVVTLPETIQTSAAINPGNSGGALVDLDGDVIGIPTLAAADSQNGGTAPGIGFAIPSNIVKQIAGQLIATGKVTNSNRGGLGVSSTDAVSLSGAPLGALLVTVSAGSAAARAGLVIGDIITEIDTLKVTDAAGLQDALAPYSPGTVVKVYYLDTNGVHRIASATLGQLTG